MVEGNVKRLIVRFAPWSEMRSSIPLVPEWRALGMFVQNLQKAGLPYVCWVCDVLDR